MELLMSRGLKIQPGSHEGDGLYACPHWWNHEFWMGPNYKYSKDSTQIHANLLQKQTFLSDRLSNRLYSVNISCLPPRPTTILCTQCIQVFPVIFKNPYFCTLGNTIWVATQICAPWIAETLKNAFVIWILCRNFLPQKLQILEHMLFFLQKKIG